MFFVIFLSYCPFVSQMSLPHLFLFIFSFSLYFSFHVPRCIFLPSFCLSFFHSIFLLIYLSFCFSTIIFLPPSRSLTVPSFLHSSFSLFNSLPRYLSLSSHCMRTFRRRHNNSTTTTSRWQQLRQQLAAAIFFKAFDFVDIKKCHFILILCLTGSTTIATMDRWMGGWVVIYNRSGQKWSKGMYYNASRVSKYFNFLA